MHIENKSYVEQEEAFLFTCDEKLHMFGYGEWVEECDRVRFEYMGYECMVHRVSQKERNMKNAFGGHLGGYVKIPEGHCWHGKKDLEEIRCHFGITYNASFHGHWIGFDCAHPGDIIPSVESTRKKFNFVVPTYKNIPFCVKQCIGIVDQLVLKH